MASAESRKCAPRRYAFAHLPVPRPTSRIRHLLAFAALGPPFTIDMTYARRRPSEGITNAFPCLVLAAIGFEVVVEQYRYLAESTPVQVCLGTTSSLHILEPAMARSKLSSEQPWLVHRHQATYPTKALQIEYRPSLVFGRWSFLHVSESLALQPSTLTMSRRPE